MSNRLPFNLPPGGIHLTTVGVVNGQTVRHELEIDPFGRISDTTQAESIEAYSTFRRFQRDFFRSTSSSSASNARAAIQALPISTSSPRAITRTETRRTALAVPPSPSSTPPPPLSRPMPPQLSERSTLTSGSTLSISEGSRSSIPNSTTRSDSGRSGSMATSASHLNYDKVSRLLRSAKALPRDADTVQGSTLEQLKDILLNLKTPMSPQRRRRARFLFDHEMARNESNLEVFRRSSEEQSDMEYGSDWEVDGIQPLETRVHVLLIYPPFRWPNWHDPSPTMNHLGQAGIWDIFKTGQLSFLHLHNHKHPSDTWSNGVTEDGSPRWIHDPPELCKELERQATSMITMKMQEGSAYLILCLGKYSHNWFAKCDNEGRGVFKEALRYEYSLEDVTIPVTETPARNMECKIFRPKDPTKRAHVAAILVNAPAFLANNVDRGNDCLGKALRLDGSLEVLRVCLNIEATMDAKQHFTKTVFQRREGNRSGRLPPRNLLF